MKNTIAKRTIQEEVQLYGGIEVPIDILRAMDLVNVAREDYAIEKLSQTRTLYVIRSREVGWFGSSVLGYVTSHYCDSNRDNCKNFFFKDFKKAMNVYNMNWDFTGAANDKRAE